MNRRLNSADVIVALAELMLERGTLAHMRSENGPEFVATAVRERIAAVGPKTAYIEPGSPWGETVKKSIRWIDFGSNGYVESFNSKLRDELLNGEIFYSLEEAKILIEAWRCHYNAIRPHSALGWQPPAPQVRLIASPPRPARELSTGMAENTIVL